MLPKQALIGARAPPMIGTHTAQLYIYIYDLYMCPHIWLKKSWKFVSVYRPPAASQSLAYLHRLHTHRLMRDQLNLYMCICIL